MAEENMTSRQQDKAQKLYQIGLKNIKLQLALNGTKFVVLRPKDNSLSGRMYLGVHTLLTAP